jgi:hypothetical protein
MTAIEDDDEPVDESGVEAKDIELVMTQVRQTLSFFSESHDVDNFAHLFAHTFPSEAP